MSIQCVDVERKTRVLNLRLTESQRQRYDQAAALEGTTVSSLVTSAADRWADEVIRTRTSVVVPSTEFDQLLAALDEPIDLAPALRRALEDPRFENR